MLGVSGHRCARRVPATGLAGWPRHRRELLLWRYALRLDYAGVDALVHAAAEQPCSWRWHRSHEADTGAVLGDDGRYHLVRGDDVLCTEVYPRDQQAEGRDRHGGFVRHRRVVNRRLADTEPLQAKEIASEVAALSEPEQINAFIAAFFLVGKKINAVQSRLDNG